MLSDIILILVASLLGLMHLLLLIPDALLSIGNFSGIVASTFAWLFAPLRYLAYWLDLVTLAEVINTLMLFLAGWYTWQIIRMVISLKSGELEQPSL